MAHADVLHVQKIILQWGSRSDGTCCCLTCTEDYSAMGIKVRWHMLLFYMYRRLFCNGDQGQMAHAVVLHAQKIILQWGSRSDGTCCCFTCTEDYSAMGIKVRWHMLLFYMYRRLFCNGDQGQMVHAVVLHAQNIILQWGSRSDGTCCCFTCTEDYSAMGIKVRWHMLLFYMYRRLFCNGDQGQMAHAVVLHVQKIILQWGSRSDGTCCCFTCTEDYSRTIV